MNSEWKSGLNAAQRQAVEHDAGALIVLAGPGTGKTHAIIARLRRLIEDGEDPSRILALTFSVKAAEEMRSRLARAVGPRQAGQVTASTFHAFGNRILQRFGDTIGLRRQRTIMDSAQQHRLLRSLIRAHDLFGYMAAQGRELAAIPAVSFIQRCRNAARTPSESLRHARMMAERIQENREGLAGDALAAASHAALEFEHHARLFEAYDFACFERGLMTYDDFLTLPLRIFAEKPFAAAIIRDEFRRVLVDEFQDVNRAQIELLRHLAPPRLPSGAAPDLCVVGDDDQAIYGFRGSDSRAFGRFAAIWQDHKTVELTENYRSGRRIIDAANALISRCESRFAPDKEIEPAHARAAMPPGTLEGVILEDDSHTGLTIAAMISAARSADSPPAYRSFGIIAPSNSMVEAVRNVLEIQGIPVAIRRKHSPTDDAAVQDLLACMRLLADPGGPGAGAATLRLLTRPPFFVSAERVLRLQQAYDHQMSWKTIEERRSLIDWLGGHEHDDAALPRFLRLAETLRQMSIGTPAETTVRHIVRLAELAHGEDLSPEARAGRITDLAAVMRWAQSRQPHLDEPGDIAALSRYYNDLSEDERDLAPPGDERLDSSGDDAPDPEGGPDAVWIMTAHKSKGLEFDTVFLARCRPGPGGFPNRRSDENDGFPPPEFLGQERDSREDEQRRLFYVACTRAKRRLVMLAKQKKSRGDATDYFIEFTQDTPGLEVAVRQAADILKEAGLSPQSDSLITDEASEAFRRDEAISHESALIRQSCYAALHDAADAMLSDEGLESIRARLADAAGALRSIEIFRATGAVTDALVEPFASRIQRLSERLNRPVAHTAAGRGMRPPLTLSYSIIDSYHRCPRCFYVTHILGISEPQDARLSVGQVVHEAIEKFSAEAREAEADGRLPPGLARLHQIGEASMRASWPMNVPFDEKIREQVLAQLAMFFEKYDQASANIIAIERKTTFLYPDPGGGDPHKFIAKIDRIDQPPPPDVGLRIVDYKTGAATGKLREPEKGDLQMYIYAVALQAALDEAPIAGDGALALIDPVAAPPPGRAEYWLLSTGERGVIALDKLDLAKGRRQIDEAITGMLAGRFERGKNCKGLCEWLPRDDPPTEDVL